MTVQIVKLSFDSLVHFGNKRLSDSNYTIAADTLFSALFIEAQHLGLDTDYLLKELIISDTFPYQSEELYLPKPLLRVAARNQDDTNYKVFKKLKYIPVSRYLDYVSGSMTGEEVKLFVENFNIGAASNQTKVSLQEVEKQADGESEPYTIGTFQFDSHAGLYFIAQGSDEVFAQLSEIMNSLQYSGLGGKRSAGYGRFTYQIVHDQSIEQLLANKGDCYILLSTARGTESELEASCKDARFILKKRTGFIQSTNFTDTLVKKKDFYSFSAGSVFYQPFKGDIYDVGENGRHPVYRYAKALWLEVAQ